jgi:hypothetical protein
MSPIVGAHMRTPARCEAPRAGVATRRPVKRRPARVGPAARATGRAPVAPFSPATGCFRERTTVRVASARRSSRTCAPSRPHYAAFVSIQALPPRRPPSRRQRFRFVTEPPLAVFWPNDRAVVPRRPWRVINPLAIEGDIALDRTISFRRLLRCRIPARRPELPWRLGRRTPDATARRPRVFFFGYVEVALAPKGPGQSLQDKHAAEVDRATFDGAAREQPP